jgi:hypothetical protein
LQNPKFFCLWAWVPLTGSSLQGPFHSPHRPPAGSGPVQLVLADPEGTLNQGRCRERTWPDLGEFVLSCSLAELPASQWRPWRHPWGCEAESSTWEFPSHLLPAGSSADTSTLECHAQARETGRRDAESQRSILSRLLHSSHT